MSDLRRTSVSLAEAARLLNVDVGRLRKALDRKVVTGVKAWQGKRELRRLNGVDVLCLRMQEVLKRDVLRGFYAHLRAAPDRQTLVAALTSAPVPESSSPILEYVATLATKTVEDMASAHHRSPDIDDNGRIRDANVEAHRIAALVAGGMSVDDVLDDFPQLSADQIAAAVDYARMKPKQGRPFPSSTVKSILRNGGGGGLEAAFAAARDEE